MDRKVQGVARCIRNCSTTNLVGGWMRATLCIFLSFQKASGQIFACQLLRITTIVAPFLIAPNLLLTNMICQIQLFSVFLQKLLRYKLCKYFQQPQPFQMLLLAIVICQICIFFCKYTNAASHKKIGAAKRQKYDTRMNKRKC